MKEKWLDVFDILYRAVKKYSPGTLVGGFCFNTNCDIQILESYLKKKKDCAPGFYIRRVLSLPCTGAFMPRNVLFAGTGHGLYRQKAG